MNDAVTIESLPAIVPEGHTLAPIDPATVFMPVPWEMIEQAAQLIATCPGLAPQFSQPDACRFIAYQAARFGADPVAFASKVYFTPRKGGEGLLVGYEAQLIKALVESDPAMLEPLDFQYGYSKPEQKIAAFRFVKVIGRFMTRTGAVTRTVTTPTIAQVKVKNSPLWFSDPDQQLAYYGARSWARRHRPARIMGIYAPDELAEMRHEIDAPARSPFEEDDADFGDKPEPTEEDLASAAPPDQTGHAPSDMDEIKTWAQGETDRICAMGDIQAIASAGNAMVSDKRFKRLIAYDGALARKHDTRIKNRISDLEAAD